MKLHADAVFQCISAGLSCDYLTVKGDGSHFYAKIVSQNFRGKSLLVRHQLIYAILGDKIRKEIHAISMQTLTPEEYAEKNI